VFVEQFIASFDKPPAELILDFDPTDVPLHGSQERRFFHGYCDHYCFLPLYVFCGQQLLVAYLRPSNIDAALHARAVLRLLVNRLRKAWPDVRILFRGDSGFARRKLMRWCEKNRVDYVIGLARNEVLKRVAEPFMDTAEAEYQKTRQKVRNFHDLAYAAETWDRERRVIAKAERLPEGPNLRFVVTSLTDQCPHCVYDGTYVLRGDMENRIKEQQLMLFANRASCHSFLANQFRLLLSSAAYAGGDPAANRPGGDRTGHGPGKHHSAEALQGRRPGGGQRPPRRAPSLDRLSAAGRLPPDPAPALHHRSTSLTCPCRSPPSVPNN